MIKIRKEIALKLQGNYRLLCYLLKMEGFLCRYEFYLSRMMIISVIQ